VDKERYLREIEKRLLKYFSASREGYKAPAEDRHRLEGFMQGAAFMGFASSKELAELMGRAHVAVFGKSIEERRTENGSIWQESVIDYDRFEQPSYIRKS